MSASPESKDELMPLRRSTRKSVATKVDEQVLTPKKRKSTATPIKNAPEKSSETVGTPRRARGTPRKSMGEVLTVTPRKSISRVAAEGTPQKKEVNTPRKANETSPRTATKETNKRTPRKSVVSETSPTTTSKRTTRKSTVNETSPISESKESTKRTPRKSLRSVKETKNEDSSNDMAEAEEVPANPKGRRKSLAVSSMKKNTSSDEDSKNTDSKNEDAVKQSPKRKARKSVHFKKEVDEHQLEPESEFSSSPSPAKGKTDQSSIQATEKALNSSLALVPKVVLTDIMSDIKEGNLAESVTATINVGDHPSASEKELSSRSSIDDALISPSKFLQSDDDDDNGGEGNKTIRSKAQDCDHSNDTSKLSLKEPFDMNSSENNIEEHFKSPRRKLSYEIQSNDGIVNSKICKDLNSFEESHLKLNNSSNDNMVKSESSTENSAVCESLESCQVTTTSLSDILQGENGSSLSNISQRNSLESEVSSTDTKINKEECKGLEECKNNNSFSVSSTDDVTSPSVINTNSNMDSSVSPVTHDEKVAIQETDSETKVISNNAISKNQNEDKCDIEKVEGVEQKESNSDTVNPIDTKIKGPDSEESTVSSADVNESDGNAVNKQKVETAADNEEKLDESIQVKDLKEHLNHTILVTHEEKPSGSMPVKDHEELMESIPVTDNKDFKETLNESILVKGNEISPVNVDKEKLNESIQAKEQEEEYNGSVSVKDPAELEEHVLIEDSEKNIIIEGTEEKLNGSIPVEMPTEKNSNCVSVEDCEELEKSIHNSSKVEAAMPVNEPASPFKHSSLQTTNDSLKPKNTIDDSHKSDSVLEHATSVLISEDVSKNNDGVSTGDSKSIEIPIDSTKSEDKVTGNECDSSIFSDDSSKLVKEKIFNEHKMVSVVQDCPEYVDSTLGDLVNNPNASVTDKSVHNHLVPSVVLHEENNLEIKTLEVEGSMKPENKEIGVSNNEITKDSDALTALDSSKSEYETGQNKNVPDTSICEEDFKTKPESIADSAIQSDLDSSKSEAEDDPKPNLIHGKEVQTEATTDLAVLNKSENSIREIKDSENKLSHSAEILKGLEYSEPVSTNECNNTENEVNSCQVIENKCDYELSQVGLNNTIVNENTSKEISEVDDSHPQNLSVSELNQDNPMNRVPVSQSPIIDIEDHRPASENRSPSTQSIVKSSPMKNEDTTENKIKSNPSNEKVSEISLSELKNCNTDNIDSQNPTTDPNSSFHEDEGESSPMKNEDTTENKTKSNPSNEKVSEISLSELENCNGDNNDSQNPTTDPNSSLHENYTNTHHIISHQSSNVSSSPIISDNDKDINETVSTTNNKSAPEEDEELQKPIVEVLSEQKGMEYSSEGSSTTKCSASVSSSAGQSTLNSTEGNQCVIISDDENTNVERDTGALSDSKEDEVSKPTGSCLESKSEEDEVSTNHDPIEVFRDSISEKALSVEKLGQRQKSNDEINPIPEKQEHKAIKVSSSEDSDKDTEEEESIKKQSHLGKRSIKSTVNVVAKKIKTTPEQIPTKYKKKRMVEKSLVESFLDLEAEEGEESETCEISSESSSDSSEPDNGPFTFGSDFIHCMANEKTYHIATIGSLFRQNSLSEDEDDDDWVPPKKKPNLKSKNSSQRFVKYSTSGKQDLRQKLEKRRRKNKSSSAECSDALYTKQGVFSVSTSSNMLTAKFVIPSGFSVEDCDIYSSPQQYIPKGFIVKDSERTDHVEVQKKSKVSKKTDSESSNKTSKKQKNEVFPNLEISQIGKTTPKNYGVAVLPFRLKKSEIKKAFGDIGINDIVSVEYSSATTALLEFSEKRSLKKALNLYGQILYNGKPIYVLENKPIHDNTRH